jgi:hypothetical protein
MLLLLLLVMVLLSRHGWLLVLVLLVLLVLVLLVLVMLDPWIPMVALWMFPGISRRVATTICCTTAPHTPRSTHCFWRW